jgi:HSP20 family protein
MDRLFDSFMRDPFGSLADSLGAARPWSPAIDVAEDDQQVVVRAEVPGVDPKDLEITVSGNRLVLSGEKKETHEKKDKDIYHAESRFGSFRRSIELPSGLDTENVVAEHAHGVVTITLKKAPTAAAKRIEIKSNGSN